MLEADDRDDQGDCNCAVCVAISSIAENCRLTVSRGLLESWEACGGDPKKLDTPENRKTLEAGKAALLDHALGELRAVPISMLHTKIAMQLINGTAGEVCSEARAIATLVGTKASMDRLREIIDEIESKRSRTE